MKVLNKVVLGVAAMTLLVACGPSKVSFEKFQEDARAASQKDPGYKKVTVKGSVKANVVVANVESKLDHVFAQDENGDWQLEKGDEGTSLVAVGYVSMRAVQLAGQEDEDCTYYSGNGFKVAGKNEDASATYVFDAYGYVTSVKGKADGADVNVTVKWSK